MHEITWSVKGNLMSYCSRSRRRRFTVLGFKSWAYSRLFMNFRCKFRHRRSIPRPDFQLQCKIWPFGDVFRWLLHFIFWMSAIFLLPVCLIYWPRKYTTSVDPTLIIPTKFEDGMCVHCRVIAFLSADTSRDLVTLTFDLLTLNSCCAWRVTLPTLPPS